MTLVSQVNRLVLWGESLHTSVAPIMASRSALISAGGIANGQTSPGSLAGWLDHRLHIFFLLVF